MNLAGLLRLLNVRASEWPLVKRFFLLQFFQGAAIAFFFTSASTQFLSHLPITELAWTFLGSSVLLWLAGFLYAFFEHRTTLFKLGAGVIAFMGLSIIGLRIFGHHFGEPGVYYALLIWFNLLYLLNNLEFWGIASVFFDVRQSKRLFSVISAGDIPAKAIGYSLASVFITFIGTRNLLWVSAFCMFASLPFLISLSRLQKQRSEEHEGGHSVSSGQFKTLVKKFTANRLILQLALMSFFISCATILANYGFYGEVKKAYSNDVALGGFIATFLATVRLTGLVVKLGAAGRILSALGTGLTLAITPIALSLAVYAVFYFNSLSNNIGAVVYAFGAACILLDVLRTTLNTPTFLSIMQPLPTHDRLRAHNIVKGIIDPFAFLAIGLFIYFSNRGVSNLEVIEICRLLMVIALSWLIMSWLVNKEYYRTLFKSLSSKFYIPGELSGDDLRLERVKPMLTSGTPSEVMNLLRLIRAQDIKDRRPYILTALENKNEQVILEAVSMAQENPGESLNGELLRIVNQPELGSEIRSGAILGYGFAGGDLKQLPSMNHENDSRVRLALLSLQLNQGSGAESVSAARQLEQLIEHEDSSVRLYLAGILSRHKQSGSFRLLERLMQDGDSSVRTKAVLSSAAMRDPEVCMHFIPLLQHDLSLACEALELSGESAVPAIQEALRRYDKEPGIKRRLLLICGISGGEPGKELLLDYFKNHPNSRRLVGRSLSRAGYRCVTTRQKEDLYAYIELYLKFGGEILSMKKALEEDSTAKLCRDALDLELRSIMDILMYLFSFIYDKEQMESAHRILLLHDSESNANALEMVELCVARKYANDFALIYENGSLEDRISKLKYYQSPYYLNSREVMEGILQSEIKKFNDWTRSTALYYCAKSDILLSSSALSSPKQSGSALLSETLKYYESEVTHYKKS